MLLGCFFKEDMVLVSVVQDIVGSKSVGGPGGVERCLPGHSTSETDSQGEGKVLWCSVAQRGALGDPRCPPNAPDAYPFHTITLRVTYSRRSANGNG